MADKQLKVHIYRIKTLLNCKYFTQAYKLYQEVVKLQASLLEGCSSETKYEYFVMRTEFEETLFNHSQSIKIIQDDMMPLTHDEYGQK